MWMPARSVSFASTLTGLLLGVVSLLGPAPVVAQEIVVEKDIEYRSIDGQSLKLNVAHPKAGEGALPCIVWIHGGGWAGGSRESFQGAMEASARAGFSSATLSYRLTDATPQKPATKNPFPAQVHDCKAAIRWLKSNASKYRIDPDHIGVIGASAGGHLSLLVGLSDADDGLEETTDEKAPSSRVQAIVNICGPTEMTKQHAEVPAVKYLIEGVCGGTPTSVPDRYKAASPVTYLTKDDPPILTFHGTADNIVLPAQAKLLDQKCAEAGVAHTLVLFEKQGHGFDVEHSMKSAVQTFEFFKNHLAKKP